MTKRDIEEILMRRDGVSREEAREVVQEAQEELDEVFSSSGSSEDLEDVLYGTLGLELDYLFAFI